MSLKSVSIPPIPEQTVIVARAAFPKGNLYLKLHDELGTIYTDEDFQDLYPERGQPALPPWQLALVTIMQFLENLSDRQAADAVRARTDWKYVLSLELTDPGFDFSVLSEFRKRLLDGKQEQLLLDKMLTLFRERGLLKVQGRQRTDSTYVLAVVRVLNRLEVVGETLRAALNNIAEVSPDWLREVTPTEWYERYGQRIEDSRLPRTEKGRTEYALSVGQDGFILLDALPMAPATVQPLPIVSTLRQMWERHYGRDDQGKAIWRVGQELARAATALESPYDIEARHSTKHSLAWTGYTDKTCFVLSPSNRDMRT